MSDIAEFCDKHGACLEGRKWALANCRDMADAWDKLKPEWLIWVAVQPGVFDDKALRLFACWSVRNTPLADGRKVWDLLTDERSRSAVEVAERYAVGAASDEELAASWAAARAAAWDAARDAAWDAARAAAWDAARAAAWDAARDAAWDAARAAAWDAARDAAWDAARAAAWDAAWAAQAAYLRSLGNPFTKGSK
jgi:hypothetical protein